MKAIAAHIIILTLTCLTESALNSMHISDVFKKDSSDGFLLEFSCSPSKIETIGKSLSLSCVEFLTTQNFNITSLYDSAVDGLCETCGQPLYQLIRDCVGQTGMFLQTLDVLCATNEQGNKCYNTLASQKGDRDLFSECERSPCSTACKRDLETSNNEHGCCLFSSLALLKGVESAEQLWSRCDVNPPDLCEGAFTSESPVVTTRSSAGVGIYASTYYMSTSIIIFLSYIVVSV